MSGTIALTGPQETPGAAPLSATDINTAVNAALAVKAPLASPALTGTVSIGSGGAALTGASLQATGTSTSTLQLEVQNLSSGTGASSDIVATADNGTDATNYIDLGINSSLNADAAFTSTGANDGYLYVANGNLTIGAASAGKTVKFITGGALTANVRATITDTGLNAAAIGATAPSSGFFTSLGVSGLLTPSQTNGIVGTTTNNAALAGSIGEFISASVAVGSAVALTSATAATVTSISLTAGDWDVSGTIAFAPAATTSLTALAGGINTVTAALPAATTGALFAAFQAAMVPGAVNPAYPVGATRLSLASTTTVYLVAQSTFTVAANAAYGFLGARRRR